LVASEQTADDLPGNDHSSERVYLKRREKKWGISPFKLWKFIALTQSPKVSDKQAVTQMKYYCSIQHLYNSDVW